MPAKPILQRVYKKTERHWQNKYTGNVAIATWKPSNRWNQINKQQYEDYLATQYCVCKHPVAENGFCYVCQSPIRLVTNMERKMR